MGQLLGHRDRQMHIAEAIDIDLVTELLQLFGQTSQARKLAQLDGLHVHRAVIVGPAVAEAGGGHDRLDRAGESLMGMPLPALETLLISFVFK